jgi:hypothetical protein
MRGWPQTALSGMVTRQSAGLIEASSAMGTEGVYRVGSESERFET